MTGVSEVTIRQDLNTLEKQSYLRRTHGFAVPLDSDDVETRMMNNYTVKRELADYAASLVSDGETVFIENGSCNALLPVVLSNVASLSLPLAAISHISLKMPCAT
jgi:DeoR/GlpR family transcriptional regulator of sugar metabolism